ncbi:MAG: poly(ribitol-phosphate) beta-N-acetylglucosaminyltransferase [Thermoleophilaceae bacterium]|nr:poly(ribitol-phosphate) beta-N-acetylglucosaminyltransferase [Thermoleophilaceae bacterium]
MLKVSAIVPVYNPGTNIDRCIETLVGQSLPRSEYEVIFVDDGSTDGTSERLDALAAEHPHVRVEHIPNSGWPGRPRNVGIDMAGGEFVYFVDNDDYLDREALERLYDRAVGADADVVIGKVVGHGKFVPRPLFTQNRDGVTLDWRPLVRLLTPHKLYRKALLDEHGIRFPEGRRRLEDHVFTMHAYFHARSISVLADHPCYHWVLRLDTSASYDSFDPKAYYGNVREVLDLVVEHTEPGPLRDRLLAHWYRGKMLGRVGGKWFPNRSPEDRRALYDEVSRLARERYGPEVDEWLGANLRVRSHLLRESTFEAIAALGFWEAELRADVTAGEPRREPDGTFAMPFSGRLLARADSPLLFERRGGRLLWVPPPDLRGFDMPERVLDMTEALGRARVETMIRARDKTEFVLPGRQSVELMPAGPEGGLVTPVFSGEARIEPGTAAAGSPPPPGLWEVLAAVTVCGFGATARVRSARTAAEYEVEIDSHGAVAARRRSVVSAARGQMARRMPGLARVLRRAKERRVGAAR